jgi:hypothetical protein
MINLSGCFGRTFKVLQCPHFPFNTFIPNLKPNDIGSGSDPKTPGNLVDRGPVFVSKCLKKTGLPEPAELR